MQNNNNNNINFTDLIKYAKTERQKQILSMLSDGMTYRGVQQELGFSSSGTVGSTVSNVRKYAESAGFLPDGTDYPIPDTQCITGISTLYKDGEKSLEWVKTSKRAEDEVAAMHTVAEELQQNLSKLPPIIPNTFFRDKDSDLLNVYVLTDYHLGMMAWDEENRDENWDIYIAKDRMVRWFEHAISSSPNAERAVLANIGDFLHWDGLLPKTPQSGHILDTDTRFQKLIRVAIATICEVIQMLKQKYDIVDVIMAEGNHDESSSAWLREMLSFFLADNEGIYVDTSADPYYCVMHGDVSLFFHHGHKRGHLKDLVNSFATKFRQEYGETKFSYVHTGHKHFDEKYDNGMMTVERHPTLAPKDQYAASNAYEAQRKSRVITYDKEFGEISRIDRSIDFVMKRDLRILS